MLLCSAHTNTTHTCSGSRKLTANWPTHKPRTACVVYSFVSFHITLNGIQNCAQSASHFYPVSCISPNQRKFSMGPIFYCIRKIYKYVCVRTIHPHRNVGERLTQRLNHCVLCTANNFAEYKLVWVRCPLVMDGRIVRCACQTCTFLRWVIQVFIIRCTAHTRLTVL